MVGRKPNRRGQAESHARSTFAIADSCHRLVGGIAVLCGLAASVVGAYLAFVTTLGATARRRNGPLRPAPSAEQHKFAFLVPAHDEEQVIAAAIASLRAQRYPMDLFEIHVVADNCTDRTVEISTAAGATVHTRTAPDDPGKGPALNWLTDRIVGATGDHTSSSEVPVDVLVIVDADTVVDPGFLSAMDAAFAGGAGACQGYYAVDEPDTSPPVALRYAALAARHYLRALGRGRIGGSVGLFGNGMAFRVDLMQDRAWSGHLIEDAEFQMQLLMDGITVEFVPDAKVSAEMPDTFSGAATQNERWELGRAQLVERFVPDLIRAAIKPPSPGGLRRRTYIDAAIDHLVPPLSFLAVFDVAAVAVTSVATISRPTSARRFAWLGAVLSALTLAAHVLTALWLVRAPRSVYRSLASVPKFVLWKFKIFNNLRVRAEEVTWTRTQRNSGRA